MINLLILFKETERKKEFVFVPEGCLLRFKEGKSLLLENTECPANRCQELLMPGPEDPS